MTAEKSIEMAESFLKRAGNKEIEAEEYLKKCKFAESISASQECIELSVKAIFLLMQKEYPKRHWFKDEEFEAILDKLPKEIDPTSVNRAFLASKFWADYYNLAKYGNERLGIGPEKIFREDEAKLALVHAKECRGLARLLYHTLTNRFIL